MVIHSMSIEVHMGTRYKTEAFPMFVYLIRLNGTLKTEFEYATLEDAMQAGEALTKAKGTFVP